MPWELPDCLDGFTLYYKRSRLIYINSALADGARRLTCSLPLVIFLLHLRDMVSVLFCRGSSATCPKEREVEIFALCLLLAGKICGMLIRQLKPRQDALYGLRRESGA